ncbi:MAG: flagellar hook-length control protein FliK [Pseudomonadales bacterium]
MNAANRPIDFLLNTESVKVNQPQRRESAQDSGVSSSKTREKSFDDVYRQQQRENAQVRKNNQADRRHDSASRAESISESRHQQPQTTRNDAADKRVQKDAPVADNGKALPQQGLSSGESKGRVKENAVAGAGKEIEVTDVNKDVEVTVSFDATEFISPQLSEQEIAQLTTEQKNTDLIALEATGFSFGELASQAGKEETVVSFDSALLTDAEVEKDADAPGFSLTGQDEQGSGKALEAAADETVVLQAQQPAAEQQAKTVVTDGVKELKQSALADAIASNTKSDVNVATATKAGATGTETNSQNQSQERLTPVATGQEFKLLREQISVAKPSAVTGKEGAIDTSTSTSTDSAAARLNGLTQASQALNAARPATVTASVQTPVNSADWGQAVSQRIMWLVNRGISSAELQLNPRDLGPVEVRINVSGEQTTVQFTSPQPAVREALESSVVRLREMMESSGLDLADVNVSDQSLSEQAQSDSRGSSGNSSGDDNSDIEASLETQVTQRIESDGMVDFYA